MDVFSLNQKSIERYENFSRSFANILSNDLQSAIDQAYSDRRYVREPLISLNPRFRPGASVDMRAADGTILADTAKIFRRNDRTPIELYVHQDLALGMAQSGKGFIVTTGTGSGKSLCFFIPLIDAAIRARAAGKSAGPARAFLGIGAAGLSCPGRALPLGGTAASSRPGLRLQCSA